MSPPFQRILRVALLVLLADQVTKGFALAHLAARPTYPVLPGLFHLTLLTNSGVAFGLFRGRGLWVTLVTLAVLAGLFGSILRRGAGKQKAGWRLTLPLGLILGGAAGNLVDRVRFGGVVDFLDFRVWPVFNLADSCITVGTIFVAWQLIRRRL